MQHAIVVFRIKWVWIWLRLPGTRVPSGGEIFGRIDYLRFQKKKKINQLVSSEPVKWSVVPPPLLKVGYTFYRNVAKIISSFPTRGTGSEN